MLYVCRRREVTRSRQSSTLKSDKIIAPKRASFKFPHCVNNSDKEKLTTVNWKFGRDMPGLLITYNSDAAIHDTMQVATALPPNLNLGINAAESSSNLKTWYTISSSLSNLRMNFNHRFNTTVLGVNSRNLVTLSNGTISNEAFQFLTPTQLGALQTALLSPTCTNWAAACAANGLSAGRLYVVHGTSAASCEIYSLPIGPFQG